eukprot:GHVS01068503.1.p2 GENE.GHVS01068503.1~~GHVS01068503.1.p2  ORF type:complete len:118 (+),score=6.65 GHVS01068503.1:196-549(+)
MRFCASSVSNCCRHSAFRGSLSGRSLALVGRPDTSSCAVPTRHPPPPSGGLSQVDWNSRNTSDGNMCKNVPYEYVNKVLMVLDFVSRIVYKPGAVMVKQKKGKVSDQTVGDDDDIRQ